MIRKPNQTVEHILNGKNGNVLKKIRQQYDTIQKAERVLASFDIPYFTYSKVCFYDGTKLLLKTTMPELKSKIRELHHDLIKLLRTHPYFQTVEQITMMLDFDPPKKQKSGPNRPLKIAENALKYLAKQAEDPKIKHSLQKLIGKYYGK